MSLHPQEDFVVERFKALETDLDKEVRKPFDTTALAIILALRKAFKKYEGLSVSIKFLLIRQELERLKVFDQIKTRYKQQGLEFVDFLKGVLETNYAKAVEHTNQMLENEEQKSPEYTEPTSVTGWGTESVQQGIDMVNLITVMLSKGKSVDEIVPEVQKLSDGQAYKAKRLARTETAQIINSTAMAIYVLSGVDKVKWTDATETLVFKSMSGKKHITRVCPRCRSFATGGEKGNGIYPIDKLPSPCPAHPNCRCTLIPIKK